MKGRHSLDETGKPTYSVDIEKREILPLLEDALQAVKRYADKRKKRAVNENELSAFIQNKFKNTKKLLPEILAKKIVATCECHPYYLQYLCHIIWEKVIDKEIVKKEDFSGSLGLLLSRESSTYEATWNLLTLKQKQVLLALAKVTLDEKLFSSAFLEKHNLGSASSLQRTLHSLTEKDLIDKEEEVYTIIDIFFKKWLIRLEK